MKLMLSVLAGAALLFAGCDPAAKSTIDYAAQATNTPPAGVATIKDQKATLNADTTKIEFVGSKSDGRHNGGFKTFSGEARLKTMAPGQVIPPEERVKITDIQLKIETDSIFADDPKLTQHLKSDDFFQAKQHPEITFKSTKIVPAKIGGSELEMNVTGDLTIRGVKKSITFPITTSTERGLFYLTAKFKINKNDFGMVYGEGKINNEVDVSVTVGQDPAPKKP